MTRITSVFACGAALVLAAATVRMLAASNASFSGFPCSLVPALTCVMSGLANPRGLAFGPEGGLYVTEAGRGGDDGRPCITRGGRPSAMAPPVP
jgi:glucose/arabinose dehydrogenase